MDLSITLKNYTLDQVEEFFDIDEAIDERDNWQEEYPEHKIEFSQLKVSGHALTPSEDNIDILSNCKDEEKLELYMVYLEKILGFHYTNSLETIGSEIESRGVLCYKGSSLMDCYESYIDEIGLLEDIPEDVSDYFDYERHLHDYKKRGGNVLPLSNGFAFTQPTQ